MGRTSCFNGSAHASIQTLGTNYRAAFSYRFFPFLFTNVKLLGKFFFSVTDNYIFDSRSSLEVSGNTAEERVYL
jgi:hypothetical protein